ncbi:hypothetical protein SBA3_1310009 [Candidatus Sulfopaludibacter sp. SbA3]|nr:hypothetical protein SBA3_1310009 [Candidatus Sulfopaludibacter sp. SbA3]
MYHWIWHDVLLMSLMASKQDITPLSFSRDVHHSAAADWSTLAAKKY